MSYALLYGGLLTSLTHISSFPAFHWLGPPGSGPYRGSKVCVAGRPPQSNYITSLRELALRQENPTVPLRFAYVHFKPCDTGLHGAIANFGLVNFKKHHPKRARDERSLKKSGAGKT